MYRRRLLLRGVRGGDGHRVNARLRGLAAHLLRLRVVLETLRQALHRDLRLGIRGRCRAEVDDNGPVISGLDIALADREAVDVGLNRNEVGLEMLVLTV